MNGSGGTQGGLEHVLVGLCLAGVAVYLVSTSVQMHSGGYGWTWGMLALFLFGRALVFQSDRVRPGQSGVHRIHPPAPGV